MFDVSQYDVLDLSVPAKGMNQNISPESLDQSYAYFLENIIPQPLGEGRVRYGTQKCVHFKKKEQKIIKQFPFVSRRGVEQSLVYVQEFVQDHSAKDFKVSENNVRQFSFTTNQRGFYVQDAPFKVEYAYRGQVTIYDTLESVTVKDDTVTVTLSKNAFPDAPHITIDHVFFAVGSLYLYGAAKQIYAPKALRTNLSVTCVPRHVLFAGKLLICNGVDRVMMWDGHVLTDVCQFLEEDATEITRVNDRMITFTGGPSFNADHYLVGSQIQIVNQGVASVVTIGRVNVTGKICVITLQENLPEFDNPRLSYQCFIPRFSFMFAMYDRLWALGEGAAGLGYRYPDQAMRIYFMYKPGASLQWFDEQTRSVPSMNLAENHGIIDNLEAISFVNGYMLFIGREKTQAWSGSEPGGGEVAPHKPLLQFHSSLPVGAVHGDLVLAVANDVFLITKTGLQSFSTLNVAQQFSANSYDAVDPLVKQYVSEMMGSNGAYRASCSFKYDGGALAGFKIGFQSVLCSLFSTHFYAWTLFSGDFKEATAFCVLGNSFYIAVDHILYKYGDGHDGSVRCFGDEGDTCPVFFSWSLPVLKFKGRAYAGYFYDLHLSYPSGFVVRKTNALHLLISGDLPQSYSIESPYGLELRGDALSTVPLVDKQTDQVNDQDMGFRFDQPYETIQEKFKFLARHFWVTLRGWTQDGVVSFKGIRFYGTLERKR
jgi:hypothetical protein